MLSDSIALQVQKRALTKSNEQKCIEEIHRIAHILLNQYHNIQDSSLFKGKTAHALFFAYYTKIFPNEKLDEYLNVLFDDVTNELASTPLNFSFANGVAGLHWGLQHVNNLYKGKYLDEDFFSELYLHLETFVLEKLKSGNYDLLYGALGGYLSLTESGYKNDNFDNKVAASLIEISTYSLNNKYWWIDSLNKKEGTMVNLGLAHGLPSLWHFIGLLYKRTGTQALKFILQNSVSTYKYFLLQESYSLFPIDICLNQNLEEINPESRRSSKLSWCYGDFCMAQGLISSGKILDQKELIDEGLSIAKHTLNRKSIKQAGVFDPCLCHGTTSCLHFYNKFYQQTGHQEFAKAVNYWFNNGLQYACFNGYTFLEPDSSEITIDPYSLLDGIIGIGLAYLSAVAYVELKWDKLLLLD